MGRRCDIFVTEVLSNTGLLAALSSSIGNTIIERVLGMYLGPAQLIMVELVTRSCCSGPLAVRGFHLRGFHFSDGGGRTGWQKIILCGAEERDGLGRGDQK